LQLARILDQHDAVAGLGDLGKDRVDERGLAGRGTAGDEHVLAFAHRDAQQLGLRRRHDAGADIVVEREDGDGRTANGEARCGHDRRHQALEPLPAFRQLGRDARTVRMDLDTDVMCNEAHDAFGVCGRDAATGIFQPARQTVDPQATVRIEHHFDDAGIFKIGRDRRAKRCAQHARTAGKSFRPERDCRHMGPASSPQLRGGCQRG